jgi:hypothetical protein
MENFMKNITTILFPNTALLEKTTGFSLDEHSNTAKVDYFRTIYKNGEMAQIAWIQVIKKGKVIAEVKENVCHIYGQDNYVPEEDE